MITSVVGEHHWEPRLVGSFFLDDEDHYGLEYWYNNVSKNNKELISALPTTNK